MSTASMAQVDTIDIGERVPNYYYWDTNWWDYYYFNYSSNYPYYHNGPLDYDTISFYDSHKNPDCKLEEARYFFTEKDLRIIGVAGMTSITIDRPSDTLLYPEYYRIYKPGSKENNDTMLLIAEARWDTSRISYFMISESWYDYYETKRSYYPIHEAYFDTPIVIHDSFYVSCTHNNSFYYPEEDSVEVYVSIFDTIIKILRKHDNEPRCGQISTVADGYDVDFVHPNPPRVKYRAHYLNPITVPCYIAYVDDGCYSDTNWHTKNNRNGFTNIFPIFDTCTHCNPGNDTCIAPSDLRTSVSQYDTGSTTLTWGYIDRAINYEVSLCKDSCQPDNGTILQSATTFLNIENLDTAQWYTVWVRTVCENDKTSPWSDSVRFYIPGKASQGTEDIQSTLDRFTILMPNPASDIVTVLSSFTILSIDIFTLNGQSVAHQSKVNAITTAFPLDNLPKGTYIVRIVTPHGTSHKKLVIN